jgi:cobalt transporter subunit CbtA
MFARIATSALFAGFAAGLIAAALQLVFVQPALLHAELYESGQLVHLGEAAVSAHQEVGGFDPVRDGLSILFTAAIYTGYAFLLVGAMALAEERGHEVGARSGMIWGLAGYVAVHLAPAVSLPPEVPGVAAADVHARQVWWFAAVAATAIGLALIAFGRSWAAWGIAVALILAPHLVGAPHPDAFEGTVPPELAAMFAGRALGVGLAAWVLLGLFAGHFWQREGRTQAQPA